MNDSALSHVLQQLLPAAVKLSRIVCLRLNSQSITEQIAFEQALFAESRIEDSGNQINFRSRMWVNK
jgi:hypothetical protein